MNNRDILYRATFTTRQNTKSDNADDLRLNATDAVNSLLGQRPATSYWANKRADLIETVSATIAIDALMLGVRSAIEHSCKYCQSHTADSMAPRHFASPNCKSGGHAHCSCDSCY